MNLLSPLVGGTLLQIPAFSLGAIHYEGINYLGLGLIGAVLLLAVLKPHRPTGFFGKALTIICVGLFVYSLSNEIYFGSLHLLHWNVPNFLEWFTGAFRAPGRYFWPIAYVLVFFVAISISRFQRWKAIAAGVLILGIQWIDLQGIRSIAASVARRVPEIVVNVNQWSTYLEGVETVYFYPKPRCGLGDVYLDLLPIQVLASTLHLNITTGWIARYTPDCGAGAAEVSSADLGTSAFVYAMRDFDLASAEWHAPTGAECREQDRWILCRTSHDLASISSHRAIREVNEFSVIIFGVKACKLRTVIGVIGDECSLETTGNQRISGFLSYGPYKQLRQGTYEFNFLYSSTGDKDIQVGTWDVVIAHTDGEIETINSGPIYATNSQKSTIAEKFTINDESDQGVEIRFYADTDQKIILDQLRVSSLFEKN